jgi:effector-binding domain-containing protein
MIEAVTLAFSAGGSRPARRGRLIGMAERPLHGGSNQCHDECMAEVAVHELQEQRAAVVREVVPLDAMPDFFGRSYHAIAAAVADQGLQVVGPPFAKYYGMPTDRVDVEAGFPVASSVAPVGSVQEGSLPAGRCYEAVHTGPYDTLEQTYNVVLARMAADGVQPSAVMWEYYLTDPGEEPDPAKWQTRVCWPVAS